MSAFCDLKITSFRLRRSRSLHLDHEQKQKLQYAALRGRCAAARPAPVSQTINSIGNQFQKKKTTWNTIKHLKNVLNMIMQIFEKFILIFTTDT